MSWIPQNQQPEKHDTYNILLRLQIVLFVGLLFVILYAFRSSPAGTGGVTILEALGVGILGSGASLLAGFLLGFVFCIPRTPNRHDSSATAVGGAGAASPNASPAVASASSSVETNSNLVEISDWLTKIIVGVGLVELSKIPGKLDQLSKYFAAGLRTCQATPAAGAPAVTSCVDSTKAFALGIIIFFSTCGFLFGYLWTRLYWQRALNDLDRVKEKVGGIGAWVYIALSRLYTGLGTWLTPNPGTISDSSFNKALDTLDQGLTKYPTADLHIEKGAVLKAYAMKKQPPDPALLQKALSEVRQASSLDPGDAFALYNAACYQALLKQSVDQVLATLKSAIDKKPELKALAQNDADFKDLLTDPGFRSLVGLP